MQETLTPKQARILEYIVRFIAEAGYAPTQREIAAVFEVSQQAIGETLAIIERKGWLYVEKGKPRAMRVVVQ